MFIHSSERDVHNQIEIGTDANCITTDPIYTVPKLISSEATSNDITSDMIKKLIYIYY